AAVVIVTSSGGTVRRSGPRSANASSSVPASSGSTTTTLPNIPSDLSWTDCGGGFQCGHLTVPVDWRAPGGDHLALAMLRRPALSPDQRVGTLVINYGGPGDAGTDHLRAVRFRLPDAVRTRFDVVSWDP